MVRKHEAPNTQALTESVGCFVDFAGKACRDGWSGNFSAVIHDSGDVFDVLDGLPCLLTMNLTQVSLSF